LTARPAVRTLVEYNDNFYDPPPWGPAAVAWGDPLLWNAFETFLREADGLIVPSPGMADLLAPKAAGPCHVLDNHLSGPPPDFDSLLARKTPGPSLGWAGSLGHAADLLATVPAVARLLAEVPDLTFHAMGNRDLLTGLGLPPGRFVATPWAGMPPAPKRAGGTSGTSAFTRPGRSG
jgi:hypothetical protein